MTISEMRLLRERNGKDLTIHRLIKKAGNACALNIFFLTMLAAFILYITK